MTASSLKLSDKRSLCGWVKFLAALAVINGHLFMFGSGGMEIARFMNLGACCVALFFFFSGYGLMCSYRQKGEKYMNGFLRHRLGSVVLPLVMAYAITLPVYSILRRPVDWHVVVDTLMWGGPYLRYSWYVTEIVVVYLLFYAIMSVRVSLQARMMILSAAVVLMMVLLWYARQPQWYYVSLPGFIIGIWYQYQEDVILRYFKSGKLVLFTLCAAIIWFVAWQWSLTGRHLLPAYRYEFAAMFASCALFPILVAALMSGIKITPPYNLIIHSSYEIYLLQNCAMIIAGIIAGSFRSMWLCTMAVVLVLAGVQYYLDTHLRRLLNI